MATTRRNNSNTNNTAKRPRLTLLGRRPALIVLLLSSGVLSCAGQQQHQPLTAAAAVVAVDTNPHDEVIAAPSRKDQERNVDAANERATTEPQCLGTSPDGTCTGETAAAAIVVDEDGVAASDPGNVVVGCHDRRPWCKYRAEECISSKRVQVDCPHTCKTCPSTTTSATATDTPSNRTVPDAGAASDRHPSTEALATTDAPDDLSSIPSPSPTTSSSTSTSIKTRRPRRGRIVTAIGSDLGVPQIVEGAPTADIYRIVEQARDYVRDTVGADDQYLTVRDRCVNRDERCAMWAAQGKCDDDEEEDEEKDDGRKMWERCAPVCWTCEQLHYVARCPVDQNVKHAWYPGDLDRLFERIVNEPYYQRYSPTVLSRPGYVPGDDATTAPYQLGPWLVVLEDFTTPDEAAKLIEMGGHIGYERSEDVGDEHEDGEVDSVVSTGRTSTNAWCTTDVCEAEPLVQNVVERMENLTGIPRAYSEELQLLRYEVGQFYEEHHDYIEIDRMRYGGVRILTVFLYLNDVEDGGETDFPLLGLSVTPKRGRVVLWPSVLNDDPHLKDERTNHQAKPVRRGIKFGANAWFHQRHFRTGLSIGC